MEENYYLAKWLNDELEGEELKAFENSLEFEIFSKIKKHSSQLETPTFDEDFLYKKVVESRKEPIRIIQLQKNWFLKIAAVLVVSIGLGFLVFQNIIPQNQIAENGKTSSFVLPDESKVVLNAGSEISFKKWKWNSNRKLNLNGEAYFKVSKGKTFKVITNLGTVTVVGTRFNVKNRKNRFEIACYEGKVAVNYQNKTHFLTKGMEVSFENGIQNNILIDTTEPTWMQSQEVSFNKENLTAVLQEIERQYNITIENKTNNEIEKFTGKIPTNDITVALKIIGNTFKLKITKKTASSYVFE